MFQPPRCPYRACPRHTRPEPRFYIRKGFYEAQCRPRPIPRFRCSTCRRTFSRQTFRADYRDHKPHVNSRLFVGLASGIGLRQVSRNLGLSVRCTQLKFRKIARHLRRLNLNLRGPLPLGATFHFDELETYEGKRNTRPLSLPVLIESRTRYILWAESAPIRPSGKMSKARKLAIARDSERFGPRKNLSPRSIARCFARGAEVASGLPIVRLFTDEKSNYPRLARKAFGRERLRHEQTNSKLVRATFNPLFAINHTEAMARCGVGRLRRRSWLVSKKRRYLDLGIQLWMAYRNYVRERFNYDKSSPAQELGFVARRLKPTEALSWRQDWGEASLHPLAR